MALQRKRLCVPDIVKRAFIQSSHATTIKGRSKRYSRYWCFTKGCRGVSVGAEGLETHLHTLLDRIQPAANLLAKLPTIAARSWGSRKERIGADSKALVRRLDDQQALNRQTIEARVRETLSDADFQTLKSSIEAEIARIQEQIKALDSEACTMRLIRSRPILKMRTPFKWLL